MSEDGLDDLTLINPNTLFTDDPNTQEGDLLCQPYLLQIATASIVIVS
jgi:hypothetical protein